MPNPREVANCYWRLYASVIDQAAPIHSGRPGIEPCLDLQAINLEPWVCLDGDRLTGQAAQLDGANGAGITREVPSRLAGLIEARVYHQGEPLHKLAVAGVVALGWIDQAGQQLLK